MKTSGNQPEPSSRSADERPVVHVAFRELRCVECGGDIHDGEFFLYEQSGDHSLCLACAGLDRLVFLPSGDTALTRRSTKYSRVSAVVVKFSRRRRRHERQGTLVEAAALEKAEAECLNDEDARARARERAAERRAVMDAAYLAEFAERLRAIYPGCPEDEARAIAEHACEKHSGRVGRTASAKSLDEGAITLAVRAHIRHVHTPYDRLFAKGWDRQSARREVADRIDEVARRWRQA